MGDLKLARDIMVTKLATLSPDASVYDGIDALLERNLTVAPVVESGRRYVGIFSEKCCLRLLAARVWAGCHSSPAHELPSAGAVMARSLITFSPDADVIDAIDQLLAHRISGAPVVDSRQRFLGVFSEKSCMSVLIGMVYDQLPGSRVTAFMDTDKERAIGSDSTLLEMARTFLDTPYRRLVVLAGETVIGQVSRRDVLRTARAIRNPAFEFGGAGAPAEVETGTTEEPELVRAFMDTSARTIGPRLDMYGIAQIFRDTPYRRLPVVEEGILIGQVSRRDLLRSARGLINSTTKRGQASLYLSALVDSDDAPIL